MRPVASTGVTRYAKRDMRLGGHYIPKGTTLLVPFDAVHHFHGNWADADAFVPVRPPSPGRPARSAMALLVHLLLLACYPTCMPFAQLGR